MPQYQTDVLIVHFNYDGRAALELEDRSRKLNKTVMIKQVAGRQGLSVFVFDVSIEEFPTLISGLPKY